MQQIASKRQTLAALEAPLDKEVLLFNFHSPDGEAKYKQVEVSTIVEKFERKMEEKEVELSGLWQEWEDIQRQIVKLGSDVYEEGELAESVGIAIRLKSGKDLGDHAEILKSEVKQITESSAQSVEEEHRQQTKRDKEHVRVFNLLMATLEASQ